MNQKARRLQMNEDTVIPIPLDSEGNVVNRSISGMYNSGIRLVSAFAYNETGECTIPTLTGNKRDYENHVFINGEPLTLTYTKYKAKIIYVNSITGGDIADQTTGALRGPVETGAGTQENPYVNLNTALRLAECYVKTTCGCFVCIKLKGTVDYQIFAKGTTCGVITGEQRVLVEAWDSAEKPIINPKLGFIRYINASQAIIDQDDRLYLISVSSMYFRNVEFVWNYVDNFKNEVDALTDSSNESRISASDDFHLLYGLNCWFESCTFTGKDADYYPVNVVYRWLYGYQCLINSSIHYIGHQAIDWCDINKVGYAKNITLTTDLPIGVYSRLNFIRILSAIIVDNFTSTNFIFDSHYYGSDQIGGSGTIGERGCILSIRSIAYNIQLHNCSIIGATSLNDYNDMGYRSNATMEILIDISSSESGLEVYNSVFEYQYKGGALYYADAFRISTYCGMVPSNRWSTTWYYCSRMESCEIRANHINIRSVSIYDCNITFVGEYWIDHDHDMNIGSDFIEKTNIIVDDANITYINDAAEDPSTESDGRYDMYKTLCQIFAEYSAIELTCIERYGTNTATWFTEIYVNEHQFLHRLENSTFTIVIDGYLYCYLYPIRTFDVVKNNHFNFTQTSICPATMIRNHFGGLRVDSAMVIYVNSYIYDTDRNVPDILFANNQITFTRTRTVPQTEIDLRSISSDITLVEMQIYNDRNPEHPVSVSNNSISGSISESWGGYYNKNNCRYYDEIEGIYKGVGGIDCMVRASIQGVKFDVQYWQLTGFTISVDATAMCTASKDPTCCDIDTTETVCPATGETGRRSTTRYYSYLGDVQEDSTTTVDYTCN